MLYRLTNSTQFIRLKTGAFAALTPRVRARYLLSLGIASCLALSLRAPWHTSPAAPDVYAATGPVARPPAPDHPAIVGAELERQDESAAPEPAPKKKKRRVARKKRRRTTRFRRTDDQRWLAQRLYRREQRSLIACDELADRRGEVARHKPAMFRVHVHQRRATSVEVKAVGLSAELLACYRVFVSRWKYPARRQPYTLEFRKLQ